MGAHEAFRSVFYPDDERFRVCASAAYGKDKGVCARPVRINHESRVKSKLKRVLRNAGIWCLVVCPGQVSRTKCRDRSSHLYLPQVAHPLSHSLTLSVTSGNEKRNC